MPVADDRRGAGIDAYPAQIRTPHACQHGESMEEQRVDVKVLFPGKVVFSAQNEEDRDRNECGENTKDVDAGGGICAVHAYGFISEAADQGKDCAVGKTNDNGT